MKDIRRYKILEDVIEKKLKGTEAAQLLNLSVVHVSRLKKRLLNGMGWNRRHRTNTFIRHILHQVHGW